MAVAVAASERRDEEIEKGREGEGQEMGRVGMKELAKSLLHGIIGQVAHVAKRRH